MAQFVGDVFGLNAVYDKQLENVANGNFASWPEYSLRYGYFAGGGPGPGINQVATINRLDFFTEIASLPGSNLPAAVGRFTGTSNGSYGYFGGGRNPSSDDNEINTISRLDFSTEVCSLPGINLSTGRQFAASASSDLYGYFAGGDLAPATYKTSIDRLDFSNETISTPVNFTGRGEFAGTSTKSYAYFAGGETTSGVLLNTISRLDFSNETVSDPGRNLPTARDDLSSTKYYDGYGYFGGGAEPTQINTITRLDFLNETVSNPGNNFSGARASMGSIYGNESGYYAGHGPGTLQSTITRLNFSTEVVTNLPGSIVLSTAKQELAGLPGGYSFLRGKGFKTYGYFGGGRDSVTSLIFRLDFSSQTFSNLTNVLSDARGYLAAISSNDYGYFAGGPTLSTIDRLDFSSETRSLSKDLPSIRLRFAGTSSNSYGYVGGGNPPVGILNTISRLDFSNETTSDPGRNLPSPRANLAAVSSNSYGYFGGGDPASPGNIISRLDFSNETTSDPGRDLLAKSALLAALSSSFCGYFCGGDVSSISRLDFSTETVTNVSNLPIARTNTAATSSNSYGYVGGGDPNPTTRDLDRLDLSTEIVNNLGNNILPSATKNQGAVSNSN